MVTADTHALFAPLKPVVANVSAVTVLLTTTQVSLRLSWANERSASCSSTFVNKKKSARAISSQ